NEIGTVLSSKRTNNDQRTSCGLHVEKQEYVLSVTARCHGKRRTGTLPGIFSSSRSAAVCLLLLGITNPSTLAASSFIPGGGRWLYRHCIQHERAAGKYCDGFSRYVQ